MDKDRLISAIYTSAQSPRNLETIMDILDELMFPATSGTETAKEAVKFHYGFQAGKLTRS